ncbi:hypothetical protein [Tessaracoccus coleopterorum]|uniref:hypothetical protein n=1 Tax=Tessaracoccus coleopterorum TaxID=2714950 RepID=UPI001E301095|nr:hypothetical protein [Tessaracoccus coleopterorum]
MATISKFSAVAMIGKVRLTGFIAWVAWLFLHLLYIAGFKQRVTTLLSWAITFITNGRSRGSSPTSNWSEDWPLSDSGRACRAD